MSIRIQMANTPALMDQVFKLRHFVFSEEEGLLNATEDKRLVDRFDAFSSTSNLVVIADGNPVGAIRLSLDTEIGLPADEYYDFRQHVPSDSRLLHIGMYCVTSAYRDAKVPTGLLQMSAYYAIANNVTHVVAPINPRIRKILKATGFKAVGEDFVEPHTGAVMCPLVLDMNELHDFFVRFAERNKLRDFIGLYERLFCRKGETIVSAGEVDQDAFIVIEGKAEVRLPESNHVIGILEAGDVFGEMSLLTDEPRSADVIASTDLQLMALPKSVFMERLLEEPEQVLSLLQLMGMRTRTLIQQLNESLSATASAPTEA